MIVIVIAISIVTDAVNVNVNVNATLFTGYNNVNSNVNVNNNIKIYVILNVTVVIVVVFAIIMNILIIVIVIVTVTVSRATRACRLEQSCTPRGYTRGVRSRSCRQKITSFRESRREQAKVERACVVYTRSRLTTRLVVLSSAARFGDIAGARPRDALRGANPACTKCAPRC